MDIQNKTINLCNKYNIKPARSKGQNFLINKDIYDNIIEKADLNKDDTVLEIGPGLGFLTERLAKKVKKVITVELDDKLAEVLKIRLKKQNIKNVKVLNENILDLSLRRNENDCDNLIIDNKNKIASHSLAMTDCYKIVANLPYNITSVFLRKFLSTENKPKSLTLMLQKEVAERITAIPGKMSLLAVSVQFYANPKILFKVPKENFYPSPKVDSAIIKINCHCERMCGNLVNQTINEKKFFRLVKHGFSSKRKMLKKNLAGGYHISQDEVIKKIQKAGFNKKVRAQELSVNDWIKLYQTM